MAVVGDVVVGSACLMIVLVWLSRLEAGWGVCDCRNDSGPSSSVRRWFHRVDVWTASHAPACMQPEPW